MIMTIKSNGVVIYETIFQNKLRIENKIHGNSSRIAYIESAKK